MNKNEPNAAGHDRREHERTPHTGPIETGGALPVDDPRAVAKRRREAEEKLELHRQEAKEQAKAAENNAEGDNGDQAGSGPA
jgi:hypothetical protein